MKMSILANFQLQIYIAAMAIGIIFCCTEITSLLDHTPPAKLRKPTQLDMWMPLPSHELVINGAYRTIYATNKVDDLKLYLDFSSPVINSTQQILNALRVNSGNFVPLRNRSNHRFSFELKHILSTEIVKVELEAASVVDRNGLPISAVAPITFLYDTTETAVSLSTSSLRVLEEPNINIVIEFTKPVFEFEASKVEVKGGSITSFHELSRALYSLTVKAESEDLLVNVPAGKVNDISGNQNMASNELRIKQYSAPSLSIGLNSFMSVGILGTSLAAATLSVSSAYLEAMGTQNIADPSINLQGLFGHLQIFVLANWISDPLPIEYLETTKGLRWLIPREKLPWKNKSVSMWPSPSHSTKFTRVLLHKKGHLTNVTMRNTPFGLPFDTSEYMTYFLRGEPLSASTVITKMEEYTGWEDLEMNLFWLGVAIVSLLTVHLLMLLFLRWRIKKSVHGVLSIPRFEIFLLILMLPCISQSSAFVIRGGTSAGTLTGILLLTIPAGAILSVSLFLIIAIFSRSFVQYREVIRKTEKDILCKRIWFLLFGKPVKGNWIPKEGLPLSFIPKLGILFDTRKGPLLFVSEEAINSNTEEVYKTSFLTRILSCARSSYVVFDLIRMVSLGIISGAYPFGGYNQSLFALLITLVQFLYLITLKPYISRGVNAVEGVSILCEATFFTLAITVNKSSLAEKSSIGYVMVGLLFFTYVSQVANVWYEITKFLLSGKNSLKLGLKNIAKGLILKKEAMNATVVPVVSPRLSPCQQNISEEREPKGVKGEKQKSEMKKLRQLAKASFTRGPNYEEGSTSYVCSLE